MNNPTNEIEIIWDRDVSNLDYVRQSMAMCKNRSRPIGINDGQIRLGYAVLKPDAEPDYRHPGLSYWDRRVFWVMESDPYPEHCPIEGIDPLTIKPNISGEQTERSLGVHKNSE